LTFDQLSTKLHRRYGSLDKEEQYQAELRARRRNQNKGLAELHQNIQRLMVLAYPAEASSKLGENLAKDYFLNVLSDRELALKIAEKEMKDLDTARHHAIRIEANEKAFESAPNRELGRGRQTRTVHDDVQNRFVESVSDENSQESMRG